MGVCVLGTYFGFLHLCVYVNVHIKNLIGTDRFCKCQVHGACLNKDE